MAIVTHRDYQCCVLSETQSHAVQILLFGPLKIAPQCLPQTLQLSFKWTTIISTLICSPQSTLLSEWKGANHIMVAAQRTVYSCTSNQQVLYTSMYSPFRVSSLSFSPCTLQSLSDYIVMEPQTLTEFHGN